jgi:hypothetical protein
VLPSGCDDHVSVCVQVSLMQLAAHALRSGAARGGSDGVRDIDAAGTGQTQTTFCLTCPCWFQVAATLPAVAGDSWSSVVSWSTAQYAVLHKVPCTHLHACALCVDMDPGCELAQRVMQEALRPEPRTHTHALPLNDEVLTYSAMQCSALWASSLATSPTGRSSSLQRSTSR